MNAFVKLRQKISPYLFLVPCLIVFGLFLCMRDESDSEAADA